MKWQQFKNHIRAFIDWKIMYLTAERDHFENIKLSYPVGSYYENICCLTIEFWNVKIAIWQALLGQ